MILNQPQTTKIKAPSIVICCHNTDNFILSSLANIKKYNGELEIIIVDSNSPNQEYFEEAKNVYNAKIITGNTNYELGAWRLATRTYQRESYLFLQDSVLQNKKIPRNLLKKKFLAFDAYPLGYGLEDKHINVINTALENVARKFTLGSYIICGSMMLISNKLWSQLDNAISHFIPQNKLDSECSERLLGLLMTSFGYNPKDYKLQSNSWNPGNYGEYFTKIFKKRQ